MLAGYFGHETAARMLAAYADAFPDLGADALRTIVMTDERYVVRTERLADAQAAHAPVWRSRYDGPYTGLEDDPDPSFAQYAPPADRGARRRRRRHLAGRLPTCPPRCTAAWGAFATTGDPGWAPYASAGLAGDDLRPGRPARRVRPVRGHPRHLVRPHLAARHLVAHRRSRLTAHCPPPARDAVVVEHFLLLSPNLAIFVSVLTTRRVFLSVLTTFAPDIVRF